MPSSPRRGLALAITLAGLVTGSVVPAPLLAQAFTLEEIMSPAFVYELVSAKTSDRIAWIEIQQGMRNVYTAEGPRFEPKRLTNFTEDDGHDLTGLQISADGEVVTFTRGHTANSRGWVANPTSLASGAERATWAIRTSGGNPWRVVQANSGTLSPDGRWFAHMKEGAVHLARVDRNADPAEADAAGPLFRVWGTPSGPRWSPDSRRIAFVTNRETHSYVGVYDIGSHEVTYLAPGVDRDANPVWSPDGTRIAFTRRPGRAFGEGIRVPEGVDVPAGFQNPRFAGGHALEIWIGDASTGEGAALWRSTSDEEDPFAGIGALSWQADHLVFSLEPEDWLQYFSISTLSPNRPPARLTHEVGFPEESAFSADGRYLYYSTNAGDIDRRHIWRTPVSGGAPERLTAGDGSEMTPAVLASGDQVAILTASASQPRSVAIVSTSGGEPRLVSLIPDEFPAEEHVTPTNVELTAADGLTFNNQLFLPKDLRPGERRPAMIFVHGGPRRQMLLTYNYGHLFYHEAFAFNQYLASKGYIVLSVNYRGGIGYGKEFRNAPNMGRNGNSEYQDVLAAGEYLRDHPNVDPSRIAIWGLSYGGILTAQALARDSELFAAGADLAGVHFWGESLDTTTVNFASSSSSNIEKWTSPVLLVHGDDDRNVAFSQTVGLVQLLRAHAVPHELIVFPDEVHEFLLHERWMKTFHAMDDFFDRYLLGEDGGQWSRAGGP